MGDTSLHPSSVRNSVHKSRSGSVVRVGLVVAAVAVALMVATLLTLETSRAAFNATTTNGSNTFAAGTVTLADDDGGSVMFSLSGMKPGDTSAKCVNVTYTGSLTADIKLYGTVGGTGLAPYLNTTIDVGTGADGGAGLSCTGFVSDSTLYSGTLAAFGSANTNYATGLGGYPGATNPTTKSYRITVALQDDNAAQGKNATATLTWEAQSL